MEGMLREEGKSLEDLCGLTMKKIAQLTLDIAWNGFRSISCRHAIPVGYM